MSTLAKRLTAPPVECCALWSESIAPNIEALHRSNIRASKNVLSCQMEIKKRANVSQVEKGDGGDRYNVENSPLSEIGGSKGARESSKDVESE